VVVIDGVAQNTDNKVKSTREIVAIMKQSSMPRNSLDDRQCLDHYWYLADDWRLEEYIHSK